LDSKIILKSVVLIVKPVNLLLNVPVKLVDLTELYHQLVHVLMDTGKILPKNVFFVITNVSLVQVLHQTVSLVLVTELTLQNVTVQLILLMNLLPLVQVAHVNVNPVILLVFVLNVLLTEKTYHLVLVLIITLKLWPKVIVSVKFVMSDVVLVTMFSIYVKNVWLVLTDLTHQNVVAQMVT